MYGGEAGIGRGSPEPKRPGDSAGKSKGDTDKSAVEHKAQDANSNGRT